jgi:hypothetical protein
MNIAEMIASCEAKRAANAARMAELMRLSGEKGETLDAAQQQEFDELQDENVGLEAQLKRLRIVEANEKATAAPVNKDVVTSPEAAAAARSGTDRIAVKSPAKLAPGVPLARLAKVKAIARLDNEPVLQVAERMYGGDSQVVAVLKANVAPGSTASGNWAANLVGDETGTFADFAEFLRPSTILGQFGSDGRPSLRQVPFREPLITQTAGGSASWVGEAKPKPLTSLGFSRTTLEPLKVATICVLTEENIRSSAPSSEMIVRDAIRDAVAERIDIDFIDPANNGSANVKPASITNGADSIAASGTGDADDVRLDIRSLLQKYLNANNPPRTGVLVMPTGTALALSLMTNALGQAEFPNITMTGGVLLGIPVITSDYVTAGYVVMVNAQDIFEADEGGIAVDMSREASLEMKDSGFTQDATTSTGVAMVSLWQSNLVGLRAERTINWARRRSTAVAYLTGVAWGGAVNT